MNKTTLYSVIFKTELTDSSNTVKITSDIKVSLNNSLVSNLIGLLNTLSQQIESGLKELTSTRTGNTATYSFETNDGRTWNQTLEFDQIPDTNPKQTFDVSDGFRLSEFTPHSTVRNLIIKLYNEFQMTTITIEII